MSIRCLQGDELTAQDVYDIWRIRNAVFAVEQRVDESEVDGLDLLPTTFHLWMGDADGVTSYLRIVTQADGLRIGRVCTRRDQRGRGQAGQLMAEAHRRWGDEALVLHAQAYLEGWYESFGYRRTGDNFDDAGIDHVPMAREPADIRSGNPSNDGGHDEQHR